MSATRRVVVTGLGAVTPVGLDVPTYWDSLISGRTGTRRLKLPWLDTDVFRTQVGAPVQGYDAEDRGFSQRQLRVIDRTGQLALGATKEALQSAGLRLVAVDGKQPGFRVADVDRDEVATAIGSGVGGLASFERAHGTWLRDGTLRGKGFIRYSLPMLIPNGPTANVAIAFGLRGECLSESTACAAGTMSIGAAFRLIRAGEARLAVAGGAEGVLTDHDGLGLAGFDILQVMSARNHDAEVASRPFDADRDGFVLGEGAGVLVLEDREHALARGAPVLAEVLSYASTCDAHAMLQPDPDGAMVARAMRLALDRAGLPPSAVGHVSAHGTATLAGDRIEAGVIREVFGDSASAPLVNATKSMTGHCIAASGALEAIATVLALHHGTVHETKNLERTGDGCELNHVMGAPTRVELEHALTASYGFGGHDAVLVLRRHDR